MLVRYVLDICPRRRTAVLCTPIPAATPAGLARGCGRPDWPRDLLDESSFEASPAHVVPGPVGKAAAKLTGKLRGNGQE